MADKVAYAGKDLGHRFQDADPHVMDAGPRSSIVTPEPLQEGDDVVGVLARQLHVGQHDLTQAIHSRHQCRGLALVRCIDVKDISTGECHCLANSRRGLTMPDCQIRYEFAPQVTNFGGREPDIAGNQLGADLFGGTMPPKQGLPHKDQDIIGNIAATRNQPQQRLRSIGAGTGRALKHHLAGDKRSRHTQHSFASALLHDKPLAAETHLPFRNETDSRRVWKQSRRQCLLRELLQPMAQRPQGFGAPVPVVFFRPCCSKSPSICATSTVTCFLFAIALANCPKLKSGLRINSTKTRTAISAGS
jgi:hypothetical protein